MWKNLGGYSKGIIGTVTAVITSLAPYYGDRAWFVALSAGLGAAAVVLVPNAPAAPAAPEDASAMPRA